MFVIISLYIICATFAYGIETTRSKKTRNILIWVCLIYMIIVSGTRLVGGMDYPTYENLYENTPTFPDVINPYLRNQNYEVGYLYLTAFFKTIGISFYGFCIFEAAFFYFCLWYGLKRYTQHFGIVILVFLYKLFFYNTMISMRQSLTVAIFFLMVPLIDQRRWVKYYLLAWLASRLHNGAYLLFILYPLTYISLSKSKIIWLNVVFFPMLFVGLAGIDVLGPIGRFLADNATNDAVLKKSQSYFGSENLSPIGIFHTLEYYLFMCLLIYNSKRLNLSDSKIHIVVWMFLCLLPLFTLFRGSEILTREKDYFLIYYAVIIGYLIDVLSYKRKALYLFILLLCAFGYYRYVMLFDNGAFLRYKSWLFNPNHSFFLN